MLSSDDSRECYGLRDKNINQAQGVEIVPSDARLERFASIKLWKLRNRRIVVVFAHENPLLRRNEWTKLEIICNFCAKKNIEFLM